MPLTLLLLFTHSIQSKTTLTSLIIRVAKWHLSAIQPLLPRDLRLYTYHGIPGWENKLLMTTLKGGRISLELNKNGTALASDPVELFRSENRYRDVAFGPDGRTVYVITDVSGPVQALKSGPINPTDLWSPGSS